MVMNCGRSAGSSQTRAIVSSSRMMSRSGAEEEESSDMEGEGKGEVIECDGLGFACRLAEGCIRFLGDQVAVFLQDFVRTFNAQRDPIGDRKPRVFPQLLNGANHIARLS